MARKKKRRSKRGKKAHKKAHKKGGSMFDGAAGAKLLKHKVNRLGKTVGGRKIIAAIKEQY